MFYFSFILTTELLSKVVAATPTTTIIITIAIIIIRTKPTITIITIQRWCLPNE